MLPKIDGLRMPFKSFVALALMAFVLGWLGDLIGLVSASGSPLVEPIDFRLVAETGL